MSLSINKARTDLRGINTSDVFYAEFKNGGSSDLAVNGSTPIVFTLEDLPAGKSLLVTKITTALGADNTVDVDKFGSVAALTNGVAIQLNPGTAAAISQLI